MNAKSDHDIVFRLLPKLSWEPEQQRQSLESLARYVADEAGLAINWYLVKKRNKSLGARLLRVGAIGFVAAAGAIPLLAEIDWFQVDGGPIVEPIWSSLALVLAGTCVGLDHFFGFSTAWMRFLTTEMQIRRALHDYLLDWEGRRATWPDSGLSPEEVEAGIGQCKAFLSKVNGILAEEMDTWVQEFSAALKTIDEAARARAETMRLGAANLTVTNGDACADGWRLSVDGGVEAVHSGKSAAMRDLVPGPHGVRVQGTISGKEMRAEKAFVASAGSTVEVTLTLA
jgi:hypothetical protein